MSLQSSATAEGFPDSLLAEFDPSAGICLLRSPPRRAVSFSSCGPAAQGSRKGREGAAGA